MTLSLTLHDWWSMFLHFVSLSMLAVGGAITTAPDIHRYLVNEQHWLSDSQFTSSIALAQAAPGPNVVFVGLMGWNVGLNIAGGLGAGWSAVGLALAGMVTTMAGILIPSCSFTYVTTQWAHRHRELRSVKAFKAGMAPLVVALLITTGWLLTSSHNQVAEDWRLWLLTGAATLIVWRTKTHLLWLLGAGALLGGLGWV